MKITPAPAAARPKTAADLRAAAAAASTPPLARERAPFDARRAWRFAQGMLDESAIALVELSALTYANIDIVERVFARTRFDVDAFSPAGDRRADLEWFRATRPPAEAPRPLASGPYPAVMDITTRMRIAEVMARIKETAGDAEQAAAQRERATRSVPARVIAFRHGSDAFIAFRGTQGLNDWGRDAMAWPARVRPLRHAGFQRTWSEVGAPVADWLSRQARSLGYPPTLHLGGHSLGGAVATLAALELAGQGFPIARVVTIGCPRAGGWRLRSAYRRTAAAPIDGRARSLVDVTLRFVHGTDIFASILPPPPLTVHMCDAHALVAEDRLQADQFVTPAGPFDTTTVLSRWLGTLRPAPLPGLAPVEAPTRRATRRLLWTQIATWLAVYHPVGWWRFAPLVPALLEQGVAMGLQHKSARYLRFFPHTELGWAMIDDRREHEQALAQVRASK